MLEIIICFIFAIGFLTITGTIATSTIFSIIEDRKQAKRNEAREQREIELHDARMKELNEIIKK